MKVFTNFDSGHALICNFISPEDHNSSVLLIKSSPRLAQVLNLLVKWNLIIPKCVGTMVTRLSKMAKNIKLSVKVTSYEHYMK